MPNPGTHYSTDVEIYDGTATFVPESGMTSFGFYDTDASFAEDAPKVVRFVATRLGWPIMDVELQPEQMFTAFEEAVTTYGNTVYAWKVRENYLSLEGGTTDLDANNMVVEPSLQRIIEIAKNYGTEAEVGGNITLNVGQLPIKAGVQEYDLDLWAKNQGIEGGIEIRKIFYEAPPAILRYFDPYAGTGTGIQSLMDAFDFGSYSPGVNFLLMPVSADLLKIQAIEFNDQVRKSAYSFQIVNNHLKLFPIPPRDGFLRIEYYKVSDKRKLNPNASSYTATSIHRMDFNATDGETLIFEHNLGTTEVEVQCYEKVTVGGQERTYMFSPESVDILGENALSVTFHQGTSGFIVISYPTLRTSVDGTTNFLGYCADFEVDIPEGQNSFTQRFVHTLNTSELTIQVYKDLDNKSTLIHPASIQIVSDYEVDITFTSSLKGHVVFAGTSQNSVLDSKVITNVSEVPYKNPTYSKINSIGRQWIFRYTLALCKEILAYVRGKYQSLPVPGSDATLNQQDLLADARTEKEKLITELNEMLDMTSRQNQLERKAQETEHLRGILGGVPMCIYIG